MALSAGCRGIVGFLIVMASEASLPFRDLPCMGCVTADTRDVDMFALLVQPAELAVTRPAVDHGLEFGFFNMACLAGHRHHRGRGVNAMTRNAVERWPVTCPMTEVAEDRGVFALQRPRMPGFWAGGRESSKGQKRSSLR